MSVHKPVLLEEILEYLHPEKNENFIDGTIGEAGHSIEILKKTGPEGKLLGIDLDPQQIVADQWLHVNFKDRIILANDSYVNMRDLAVRNEVTPVHGILLDLGMSSRQLEAMQKGFSFKVDQGLDMRYNDHANYLTAGNIVNEWPEEKLERIISDYGEERYARKIAKNIVETRKTGRIKSTLELIEVIRQSLPKEAQKGKIHFATRTFQALRIAVNDELENVRMALPEALDLLTEGGRLAVISFHSLEDRIVKNFFQEQAKNKKLKIITKKPVTATIAETKKNPRARSAKLRVAIKI